MDATKEAASDNFGNEVSDVRVRLINFEKRPEWFDCHSSILSVKSNFFAKSLSESVSEGKHCVEVHCPELEYENYVKLLKLLYLPNESLLDSLDSVRSVLGILRASLSLQCELITKCCMDYLEAVPWDDEDEEEILEVVSKLGPEAAPVLARLQPPSAKAVKDVLISAIRFATTIETQSTSMFNELITSAQEQIEYMLLEDDDAPLVIMDEDVKLELRHGLAKLFMGFQVELSQLAEVFTQSPELAEQRLLSALVNIEWISNVLPKPEMMKDFILGWTDMSDQILTVIQAEMYKSGLWAMKLKLVEVAGRVFDAIGYGSVVLPMQSRLKFLRAWMPYVRSLKPQLDIKSEEDISFTYKMDTNLCQNIECAIVSLVLALPSSDQADILTDWMNCTEQQRYPDLTEAFEVWCYRTKSANRRLVTSLNDITDHIASS